MRFPLQTTSNNTGSSLGRRRKTLMMPPHILYTDVYGSRTAERIHRRDVVALVGEKFRPSTLFNVRPDCVVFGKQRRINK